VTYHFNMYDGRVYPHTLGTECLTFEAARIEVVQRIGRSLAQEAAFFRTVDERTMYLTDSNGLTLFYPTLMAAESPAVGGR